MKLLLALAFITLLAFGTGCAWISPSSQTTSDGIQVHGHWTVTVTNPDGTVDAVQEFSNELSTDSSQNNASKYSSADLLTALLAGETSVDDWQILVNSPANSQHALFCDEQLDNTRAIRLQAAFARDVTHGTPLRLTATCTVEVLTDTTATTELNVVSTRAHIAQPITTYGTDSGANNSGAWTFPDWINFTQHWINNPTITLQHNQAVTFNVVISFQSGS